MKTHTCPHCNLLVEVEEQDLSIICPQCYNTFSMPRGTNWTVLVVPILAIQHFVLYVF